MIQNCTFRFKQNFRIHQKAVNADLTRTCPDDNYILLKFTKKTAQIILPAVHYAQQIKSWKHARRNTIVWIEIINHHSWIWKGEANRRKYQLDSWKRSGYNKSNMSFRIHFIVIIEITYLTTWFFFQKYFSS